MAAMHHRRIHIAGLVLALLSGCAALRPVPPLPSNDTVVADGASFRLEYGDLDARSAREVAEALRLAVPRIERWGRFDAPMAVRIHATHDALEGAVRHFDLPWLRAWARYDSIDLQSPRTWSMLGAQRGQIVELLTHELTHCLMYQNVATASDWAGKRIPLWFREGMASVTASQGYRRPTEEDLWRYLRANPDKDPVGQGDALYQTEQEIVYGASHRAFDYLVRRHGDESVRRLMSAMKDGSDFPAAFEQAFGITPDVFAARFLDYVRGEAWRDGKPARASSAKGST